VLEVAPDLLGCVLRLGPVGLRITEVEAYDGANDPASHAFRGLTPRTTVMFGPPGHVYVYFTYGMHWMMNAVTERDGYPSAVLIRALEPLAGFATMRKRRGKEPLCTGPARLCEALGVTGKLNGVSLQRGLLRIVEGAKPRRSEIVSAPRIGITQATDWLLRFYLKDSPYVSRG
jgi:DNA-3-methyladenine glycosylase